MVDVASRVASLFDSRFLRSYTKSKIRTDPVYAAAWEHLRDHEHPLLDIGCGIGIFSFFLREHGFEPPIAGIDHDGAKIEAARRIGARYERLSFDVGDARALPPFRGSAVLLDVLHYFVEDEQRRILRDVAAMIPAGGLVIIRDAVRDDSWRYRVTYAQESFSRVIRWLKAERLHFPTRQTIMESFAGFEQEIVPLWGKTPFNNYLFVMRKR